MIFNKIYVFLLKILSCFKKLFYKLFSKGKCEDETLDELKKSYMFFTQKTQEYAKIKRQAFLKLSKNTIFYLNNDLKLESISMIIVNDHKIIKEWKDSNSKKLISLYNKEIENVINTNLTRDGEKIQIIIKINEKIPEFIFWEFIVSREYVEFGNCQFFTQKECYLDYFPKEVRSIDYLLYYRTFLYSLIYLPLEQYKAKITTEDQYIKSSTIKIKIFPSQFFFDIKDFEKQTKFKFTDYNLSIKQSEEFEESMKTPEVNIFIKPIALFFESTKKILNNSLDVFVSVMNPRNKKIEDARIVLEISKDGKITREVESTDFSLVEIIQQEETFLKVILCRPTVDVKNSIKDKDSLSIEFLDLLTNIKSTNITLDAEESIDEDFTYTTFTIKKGEVKNKDSNLFDVFTKEGLVSITLNGVNGMIGTYDFYVFEFKSSNCIYSDKLINIPFETN